MAPYSTDNIYYTQSKDSSKLYAFYLSETDAVSLPAQVVLKNVATTKGSKISLLGMNAKLKWKTEDGNIIITIPSSIAGKLSSQHAAVFKIEKK
jgi:alpha-L-fucosidase